MHATTIARMKLEMKEMANDVWVQLEEWEHHIQRGRVMLQHISNVYSRIFSGENQLDELHRPRDLRTMERRIRLMYLRLDIPFQMMQHTLGMLTEIRDKTARMQSRVSLWMLDENFENYNIKRSLTTQMLLEMLNFLCKRYDAEWEVKEMVVLNLHQVTTSYDLEILREAWSQGCHIGGGIFQSKMRWYYDAIGRRQSLVSFMNPPLPYTWHGRRRND